MWFLVLFNTDFITAKFRHDTDTDFITTKFRHDTDTDFITAKFRFDIEVGYIERLKQSPLCPTRVRSDYLFILFGFSLLIGIMITIAIIYTRSREGSTINVKEKGILFLDLQTNPAVLNKTTKAFFVQSSAKNFMNDIQVA